MNKHLEKTLNRYAICSMDENGKVVYLHSLRFGKWELTHDICRATKTENKDLADELLSYYLSDTLDTDGVYAGEWVIVPMVIEYSLIEE